MHRPRLASYIFLLRLCTSAREFARCNSKRELSATRKALRERDGKEELGTISLNIKTYLRAILLLAVATAPRDTGASDYISYHRGIRVANVAYRKLRAAGNLN